MSLRPFGAEEETPEHPKPMLEEIGEILQRKNTVVHLMSKTAEGLSKMHQMRAETHADLVFDLFRPKGTEDKASINKLLKVLRSFGIRDTDPRLRMTMQLLRLEEERQGDDDSKSFLLDREQFKTIITPSIELISKALRSNVIIPNWTGFCADIREIFEKCRLVKTGQVAQYIPQLSRCDPNVWGVSICTIDGQRFSVGDAEKPFCVQSISKAFNYAIVASDLGAETVHSYVGHEPSGRLFNEICLDANGKPHNPLINAGAIIVTSLLKHGDKMADRFDFVIKEYRKLAGGEYVGFDNATFLSERETADRNYALSYYMKENGCFPEGVKDLKEELDFYFQLCSIETTCESAAVMAATLANGGVCPLSGAACIAPRPCRDILSLMYSCGMYDYSGKFSFQVGLPAKSGVSGAMVVVVPNLMGICLYSPPLDKLGNSTRGVEFCQKLIERFNFHNYDSLLHAESTKVDPRRGTASREAEVVVALLFAAKNGDLDTVRRMYLQGTNLEMADYDGRTALHIAASEGHAHIIKFLLHVVRVDAEVKDRNGRVRTETMDGELSSRVGMMLINEDDEDDASSCTSSSPFHPKFSVTSRPSPALRMDDDSVEDTESE